MKKPERLKYQTNKLGFWLVMGYIIFNVLYTIDSLANMRVNNAIGIDTAINIAILLVAFLAAVKVKTYHKNWAIFILILGIFQFVRILIIPAISDPYQNYVSLYLNFGWLQPIFDSGNPIANVTQIAKFGPDIFNIVIYDWAISINTQLLPLLITFLIISGIAGVFAGIWTLHLVHIKNKVETNEVKS